jgi:hypothetical protein
MVPNLDPGNPPHRFITDLDGTIRNNGIALGGSGVIGEQFTLFADCGTAATCSSPPDLPPKANAPPGKLYNGYAPPPVPNLEYLPGAAPNSVLAVPACAAGGTNYELAVAGCDQATIYQCGVQSSSLANPNQIDLSENPGGASGDTAMGAACLISNSATVPTSGQDDIDLASYPFTITAGSSNRTSLSGSAITASNSIMTLPIFQQRFQSINATGTTNVTILGFLQVFVNQVNADGSVLVTVLNVSGCGDNAGNNPVIGSSPVPVRLINPPSH